MPSRAPSTAPVGVPAPTGAVPSPLGPAAAPTAAHLLAAWDLAAEQDPVRRTLTLLRAGYPGRDPEELAALPVGRRDAALLDLRETVFGDRLVCLAACPGCGDQQELRFRTGDVRVPEPVPGPQSVLQVRVDGYVVDFRLPTSTDLAALVDLGEDLGELPGPPGAALLLRRCVVRVCRNGRDHRVDRLPRRVGDEVARRMAELDPQAEVELAVSCPGCARDWPVLFDIGEHLWREVDAWARRLLLDVHTLASAYGWSEGDVLALPPHRRRFYLEAVG